MNDARATAPPVGQPCLDEISDRIAEPVRVALVGRVNAGKSTTVNALLGQKVAPTDVRECTSVVTWYHYGNPERVVAVRRDGGTVELQLEADGTLPQELTMPPGQVASLHAYLANDALRRMTLVDTPGIGSVHDDHTEATLQLFDDEGRTDDTRIDAFLYLLSPVMMEDEHQTLELVTAAGGSAANVLGLLGRADQLADEGEDPWPVAQALAASHAERLSGLVSRVVPLMTLIAETARSASLTEHDAQDLAELAASDRVALERSLWSADRFMAAGEPVSEARRRRLLTLLDVGGIRKATDLIRAGIVGAGPVCEALARHSGIATVREAVDVFVGSRDELLKTRSVLASIFELSYREGTGLDEGTRRRLRDGVEAMRLDPEMHQLAEMEALRTLRSTDLPVPEDLIGDLTRLVVRRSSPALVGGLNPSSATSAADMTPSQLVERLRRWRTYLAGQPDPRVAQLVRVAFRGLQIEQAGK